MNWIKNYFYKGVLSTLITTAVIEKSNAQINFDKPIKVSHAEPLYNDLVRDLGALKGEKEFNFGANFSNINNCNKYNLLAEYEFAPINRLGLEAEVDFSFYNGTVKEVESLNNKIEGLRLSAQYSFFVSATYQTTLAVGYTQVIGFTDFKNYGKQNLLTNFTFNPFFVAAKRWGNQLHSLVYATSVIEQNLTTNWEINTSFHYNIPHSKHFIGVEFNNELGQHGYELTVRPQAKIRLSNQLAIGFVTGIPICASNNSFSSFFRIIYLP